MGLADLLHDRPSPLTTLLVGIQGPSDRPFAIRVPAGCPGLLIGRTRIDQSHRLDRPIGLAMMHHKLRKHKIPIPRSSRSLVGQRSIRQNLESKRRDSRRQTAGRHQISVVGRILAAGQIRSIRQPLERYPFERHQRVGLQNRPRCLRGFPSLQIRKQLRSVLVDQTLHQRDLLIDRSQLGLLRPTRDLHIRPPIAIGIGSGVQPPLLDVRKKRTKAIEVLGRKGIELVIVALGTPERDPQPSPAGIPHALGHVLGQILPVLNATLGTHHPETVVTRCNPLLETRRWQQIPGQLLDGEGIERLVGIERFNHILAKRRYTHLLIPMVAYRIGIPDQVHPPHRHPLSEMGGRQESIDQALISLRRLVLEILLDLRLGRR